MNDMGNIEGSVSAEPGGGSPGPGDFDMGSSGGGGTVDNSNVSTATIGAAVAVGGATLIGGSFFAGEVATDLAVTGGVAVGLTAGALLALTGVAISGADKANLGQVLAAGGSVGLYNLNSDPVWGGAPVAAGWYDQPADVAWIATVPWNS